MSDYNDADTPQSVFLRFFLMHLIKKLETEFTGQVTVTFADVTLDITCIDYV